MTMGQGGQGILGSSMNQNSTTNTQLSQSLVDINAPAGGRTPTPPLVSQKSQKSMMDSSEDEVRLRKTAAAAPVDSAQALKIQR